MVVQIEQIGVRARERQTIASGRSVEIRAHLRKVHGTARWRKRKGVAKVRLEDQTTHLAEVHWYEATGIGKKEFKIKRFL